MLKSKYILVLFALFISIQNHFFDDTGKINNQCGSVPQNQTIDNETQCLDNKTINEEYRCCYIKLEGIGHPHCTKLSKNTQKYITEIKKEISESLDRNIEIICYTKDGVIE